jgi:hypothetical protein
LNYVWVAEKQESNGDRLHFHLLVNSFWDIEKYNAIWVKQQYRAGLTNPAATKKQIYKAYKEGNVQDFLNPFDVKKVSTINGLSWYLTKYVTKNESRFRCSAWHCSRSVSRLFTHALTGSNIISDIKSKKNVAVNKKTGQVYEYVEYINEYCAIRSIVNKKYFEKKHLNVLNKINEDIIQGIRHKEYAREVFETKISGWEYIINLT